jgi:hypothetical protein
MGRFWGWDPKEVGALAVLAWNGVALAALGRRPAALTLALLAVVGGVVVTLAWFGSAAAMASHGYGTAAPALAVGVAGQFAVLGLGLLPEGCLGGRGAEATTR